MLAISLSLRVLLSVLSVLSIELYYIKLLQPRISLLISLILVGFNSITDTRILYDIIKALYNTRRILIKSRFKDIDNDKSFAKSI